MNDTKRKLLGIFRSKSTSGTPSKSERKDRNDHVSRQNDHVSRQKDRTVSNPTRKRPGRSPSPPPLSEPSTRKPSGRRSPSRSASVPPEPQVLAQWPPPGISVSESLSQGRAMELVAAGAPVYKGHQRQIAYASDEYYMLYATCEGTPERLGSDCAQPWRPSFTAASLTVQGAHEAQYPWETLEQPSLAFYYGTRPGTVTLNHWVSLSSIPRPEIELRDPGVKPREIELSTILERLRYLEHGFEEDYPDLMYKNLYKNLLHDPEKRFKPHKATEKQIADLITILSRPEWIDFSKPENQVVAKFFSNAMYAEQGRYKAFFHQLLLSMELDLRINSKHHATWARERVTNMLPPCVKWDLALARKWRACMAIERFNTGGDPEQIKFNLLHKRSQIRSLHKFATAVKWPSLPTVTTLLRDTTAPLEDLSSDSMSYFTGVILPGPTLPFLLMNTLIDCASSASGTISTTLSLPSSNSTDPSALSALTHMYPFCGFQYRSTTYWTSTSIVGKVLAPTCAQEIAGWIGPARPAPDLARVQIARIRQRRPKQRLAVTDVESMTIRSDPLGPPAERYPVADYTLLKPDDIPLHDVVDFVRIEKLALKPVVPSNLSHSKPGTPSPNHKHGNQDTHRPQTFDAAVQFAIDGRSWPLRLSYDVSFIAAHPCAGGPHPLFFDYVFQEVQVDQILTIRDWGGVNGGGSVGARTDSTGRGEARGEGQEERPEDVAEKVLLVDARGVSDNEVLARAWCAHWGLSAVVLDLETGCKACAIREAYAACLNVVIVVQGRGDEVHDDDDDDDEKRRFVPKRR